MKIENHKFSDSDVKSTFASDDSFGFNLCGGSGGLNLNKADAIAIADHFGVLKEIEITDPGFKFSDGNVGLIDLSESTIVFDCHPDRNGKFNKDDVKAMAKHFGIKRV